MDVSHLPTGAFRSADSAALGVTRRQFERAASSGLVRRVTRGVYVRADVPDSVELRAAAAALVISPHHVAVNRTAAWLHGVDMLVEPEHDRLPPIETCALRGRNPTRRPDLDGRTRDLSDSDVMRLGEVRVTTPLRTALDLGCELRRREAFAAMTMLARLHGLSAADLLRELPRYRRRRGVVQCRALAPLVDPRLESPREAWTLLALLDGGLPAPEIQWWVERDGIPVYRLDLAYVRARVAIEYDGEETHGRTEDQRFHDRERREWLRDQGWSVIVVRRGDFSGAALDRWLRRVQEALAPSYTNRRW